jgi:hypothetical protein
MRLCRLAPLQIANLPVVHLDVLSLLLDPSLQISDLLFHV